jgi:hypothetical protein
MQLPKPILIILLVLLQIMFILMNMMLMAILQRAQLVLIARFTNTQKNNILKKYLSIGFFNTILKNVYTLFMV